MLTVVVLCLITFHGLEADVEGAQSPSPRQLIRSPFPPYPGDLRLTLNDGEGELAGQRRSGRGLAFDWITVDFVG